ncbi:hypothetical protein BKA80DRAFT_145664 [Phyllosticta citrichinensis]
MGHCNQQSRHPTNSIDYHPPQKGISENLVPSPTPFKADYELQAKTGCNREQPTAPSLIHRCLARLHPMVLIHIPLVLETSRGGAVHRIFPFQSEMHISKDSGSSHQSAMHRERLENPRHKREEREQGQQSYQDSRMVGRSVHGSWCWRSAERFADGRLVRT